MRLGWPGLYSEGWHFSQEHQCHLRRATRVNPQQRKRKVIFHFIQPDTPLDTRNVSAILNRKRMNALFHGIERCSGQIGCEVNKHYFSVEFSYKMTRNPPMRIEKKTKKERKKQKPVARRKKRRAVELVPWLSGWQVLWLGGWLCGWLVWWLA